MLQKQTVADFMLAWLRENKRNTLKPTSYDRLEQTINYQIIPQIGHIQVAALQPTDVQKMINKLHDDGLSYSTIKKAYNAVNDCFRTGVIQKQVLSNPALGVSLPIQNEMEEKEIRVYNEEELQKIFCAAVARYKNGVPKHRLGDAVILDANTGLRLAELCGLRWSDVNLANRILSVRNTRVIVKNRQESGANFVSIDQKSGKTKSSFREIDLNDSALKSLERLQKITGEFEYVLSTRDGHPVNKRNLDRMFRKIGQDAGLPEDKIYGFHALRHTFASMLFANDVDVKLPANLWDTRILQLRITRISI